MTRFQPYSVLTSPEKAPHAAGDALPSQYPMLTCAEVVVPQQLLSLPHDADLESFPDGAEQIYWTELSTRGMCPGAAGIRLQASVLQVTTAPGTGQPDTYVRCIGQRSARAATIRQRSWGALAGTALKDRGELSGRS